MQPISMEWPGYFTLKIGTQYGNRTRLSALKGQRPKPIDELSVLAHRRGLEPLASDVTGRRSNQLS